VDEGRSAREFVDEKVGFFRAAEDALLISPDRFIRTTDPDHVRAAQEMVRRAHANGDIYLGTYEGWYCPNEGFRNAADVQETPRGTICPNHPDVPLQWLTEKNWFFRLSAYQERLERHFAEHPDFVQPDYRRNEMLGFIRGGLEDFSISRERTPGGWGIPFPIGENGETAQREDGSWDPEAGVIYVWYDALINYITGAGFPDDMTSFERWWPADLHVIGKDIARFHTIFWPAMLWSAGLEAPGHVWVHGWLLAAGGERMSKSRGNFLDPNDFVSAFGADGARYVVLREVPFDRDAEVSWDSFVRRYNADLANDFGNLVNRTVSMTNRYLDGERPAPRPVGETPLGEGWTDTLRLYVERLEGCLLHDALAELLEFVGGANKVVDAEKPWELAKAVKAGDEAAADRLRGVLGDLLEACRLVGLAAAPYMPGVAPRVLGQLGHAYDYGADGNGGPPILDELVWGARAGEAGRVTAPEPLFPRLDVDADAGLT
jgi:methionyl-tRNA synthetase